MPGNNTERSLELRTDDVQYVMESLLTGRSCAFIGVAGIGKTSLLRYLEAPPVRQRYLGERCNDFIVLPLDAHEFAQPSSLAYYRRMIVLLNPILLQNNSPLLVDNPLLLMNEEVAQQALFESVEAILGQNERQALAFFFDAFEIAFSEVEPYFYRVLEALRSRANGRISYVIASDNLPSLLCDARARKMVRDMFSALFNGRVRGIKPFGRDDADALIESLLAQEARAYPAQVQRLLLEITGAHAGLLKAAVAACMEGSIVIGERESAEPLIERLLRDEAVTSRCEQLWNSLSAIEQQCLKQMRGGTLSKSTLMQRRPGSQVGEALRALVLKGILVERSRSRVYRCFSPLLTAYIAQQAPAGLHLDTARQQVWIDGVLQTKHLTAGEFRLLCFLAEHAGEVCSRQETTRAVYNEDYSAKHDDARLDALIERTRKSIGDDSRSPRFLETVRGMGHRLNEYLGERA